MTLIFNLGMSPTYADINWPAVYAELPATMQVDYIRIYQNTQDPSLNHSLGCDPPGYPSTAYVAQHPKAYRNWNATLWSEIGYLWPKNSFMNEC